MTILTYTVLELSPSPGKVILVFLMLSTGITSYTHPDFQNSSADITKIGHAQPVEALCSQVMFADTQTNCFEFSQLKTPG